MSKTSSIISVEGLNIKFYTESQRDFISLTDMARRFSERTEVLIQNWLRNRNTVEFLGLWESLNNPGFNHIEFDVIRNRTGLNTFTLSAGEWVERTGALGLQSKPGRYGGTFAHPDIAFEFGSWLSPSFKLLIIREFQRLKAEESAQRQDMLAWDVRRMLSKINYHIHTDAVRQNLVPVIDWRTRREGFYFASEADVLNVAVFGATAAQWRAANPEGQGNMRDYATPEQLLVLANLEAINAEMIREGLKQDERAQKLNEIAVYQMQVLTAAPTVRLLER